MTARAYTAEEIRALFLDRLRNIAAYWGTEADAPIDAAEGVAFSFLSLLDGSHVGIPSFELVCRPHAEDKEFCQQQGENWVEDGTIINENVSLHEFFYSKKTWKGARKPGA